MAVGLDQDTESLQRGSIPSGGAGTLSDGAFANCATGVWLYRPTSGNSYGLTADGGIIHYQAGAREVKLGFDNTFGGGTASDPLLQVIFNSGGGTGAVQTFASANFLDEWVFYFIYEASATQHAGYIRLSAPSTVVKISRSNDNAGSQYVNTLTFGNVSSNNAAVFGRYAFARARYASGLTDSDMIAWAASTAPLSGDWGFWPLDTNTDNVDDSGNSRDLTFNGTLTTETSPSLAGPPPTISVQPVNQRVEAGSTATVSVTASGTGTLLYQWQTNASGSWVNISGATSSSYTTGTLTAGTAYAVRVNVTDDNGTTASSPTDIWTPAVAPPSWAGLYGRGGQRGLVRGYAFVPNSKAGALAMSDALFGAAATGGAATVNGQTLTATASVVSGAVTGAATVSGQTATSTASVIAGAVQAAATVSGQVVNATASLIAGAVTAAADVAGQTLTVNESVLAGTASGGGATVVNGQTLTVNASVIAGAVEAAALVDSQVITVVAGAIAGTVQAAATIAGQLLTSTASVIAGAVEAAAVVDGQTLTVNASVLAGTASGGGAAAVNGQTITATASVIAGAVTGAAQVDGQLLTVSASVLPGGAFVPSNDPALQSKALRTGIGMGL